MKHTLSLSVTLAAALAATVPAFAQNGNSRTIQQLTPPAAPAPAPAPQLLVQPPALAQAPAPQSPPQTRMPDSTFEQLVGEDIVQREQINLYTLGAGAIAGVIAFNVLSVYFAPASAMAGGPLVGTALGPTAVAASRVYAVTSAVAGALTAQWLSEKLGN